jgi:hypothetical protein
MGHRWYRSVLDRVVRNTVYAGVAGRQFYMEEPPSSKSTGTRSRLVHLLRATLRLDGGEGYPLLQGQLPTQHSGLAQCPYLFYPIRSRHVLNMKSSTGKNWDDRMCRKEKCPNNLQPGFRYTTMTNKNSRGERSLIDPLRLTDILRT